MQIYKVKRGDTLGKIAKHFGVTVAKIRAVNPEITNPNQIQPGQMIDIPGPGTPSTAPDRGVPPTEISAAIVGQAKRFVNLFEIESNARWDDPTTPGPDQSGSVLKAALEEAGWQEGWPYCAAFCEAVWRLAYTESGASKAVLKRITSRLNPSVMQSFRNWQQHGAISRTPEPGAIFFMQKGRSGFRHAGIVARVFDTAIATIEGNTSPDPRNASADREGDGVFKRTRKISFEHRPGLWMRGFLNPLEPD